VLLVEKTVEGVVQRVGLGKVFKEAFHNPCCQGGSGRRLFWSDGYGSGLTSEDGGTIFAGGAGHSEGSCLEKFSRLGRTSKMKACIRKQVVAPAMAGVRMLLGSAQSLRLNQVMFVSAEFAAN
jgi:hypothetical protein